LFVQLMEAAADLPANQTCFLGFVVLAYHQCPLVSVSAS